MNETAFEVTRIVFAVATALITIYLIPVLHKISNGSTMNTVVGMVKTAVYAAEQTITQSGAGKAKKKFVINLVTDWLNEKGIKITEEQLSALIEASVYQMNQSDVFAIPGEANGGE